MLRLPANSLTKEIALTQDLLKLFVEYQIPSDLLSYSGPPGASVAEKLEAVKEHVRAIISMIDDEEKVQLEQRARQREFEKEEEKKEEQAAFDAAASRSSKEYPPPPRPPPPSPPPPSPPPPEPPKSPSAEKKAQQEEPRRRATNLADDTAESAFDFSRVPALLEAQYTTLDPLGAIRPTSIKVDDICYVYHSCWWLTKQQGLLAPPKVISLSPQLERQRAFDLLDALTRSGALQLDDASLHVIVGATHVFADSVMETLVAESINPIEKLESSSLIIASVVHNVPPQQLLADDEQLRRVQQFASPVLSSKAERSTQEV